MGYAITGTAGSQIITQTNNTGITTIVVGRHYEILTNNTLTNAGGNWAAVGGPAAGVPGDSFIATFSADNVVTAALGTVSEGDINLQALESVTGVTVVDDTAAGGLRRTYQLPDGAIFLINGGQQIDARFEGILQNAQSAGRLSFNVAGALYVNDFTEKQGFREYHSNTWLYNTLSGGQFHTPFNHGQFWVGNDGRFVCLGGYIDLAGPGGCSASAEIEIRNLTASLGWDVFAADGTTRLRSQHIPATQWNWGRIADGTATAIPDTSIIENFRLINGSQLAYHTLGSGFTGLQGAINQVNVFNVAGGGTGNGLTGDQLVIEGADASGTGNLVDVGYFNGARGSLINPAGTLPWRVAGSQFNPNIFFTNNWGKWDAARTVTSSISALDGSVVDDYVLYTRDADNGARINLGSTQTGAETFVGSGVYLLTQNSTPSGTIRDTYTTDRTYRLEDSDDTVDFLAWAVVRNASAGGEGGPTGGENSGVPLEGRNNLDIRTLEGSATEELVHTWFLQSWGFQPKQVSVRMLDLAQDLEITDILLPDLVYQSTLATVQAYTELSTLERVIDFSKVYTLTVGNEDVERDHSTGLIGKALVSTAGTTHTYNDTTNTGDTILVLASGTSYTPTGGTAIDLSTSGPLERRVHANNTFYVMETGGNVTNNQVLDIVADIIDMDDTNVISSIVMQLTAATVNNLPTTLQNIVFTTTAANTIDADADYDVITYPGALTFGATPDIRDCTFGSTLILGDTPVLMDNSITGATTLGTAATATGNTFTGLATFGATPTSISDNTFSAGATFNSGDSITISGGSFTGALTLGGTSNTLTLTGGGDFSGMTLPAGAGRTINILGGSTAPTDLNGWVEPAAPPVPVFLSVAGPATGFLRWKVQGTSGLGNLVDLANIPTTNGGNPATQALDNIIVSQLSDGTTVYDVWYLPTSTVSGVASATETVIYDFNYVEWTPSNGSIPINPTQIDADAVIITGLTATTYNASALTVASSLSSGVAQYTITSAATSYTADQASGIAVRILQSQLYLDAVANGDLTNTERLIVFGQLNTITINGGSTVTDREFIRLNAVGQRTIGGMSGFVSTTAGTDPNTFDTVISASLVSPVASLSLLESVVVGADEIEQIVEDEGDRLATGIESASTLVPYTYPDRT